MLAQAAYKKDMEAIDKITAEMKENLGDIGSLAEEVKWLSEQGYSEEKLLECVQISAHCNIIFTK